MPAVREDVHIHAPASEVFARLTDLDGYASWLPPRFEDVESDGEAVSFRLPLPMAPDTCRLVIHEREAPSYVELQGAEAHERAPLRALAWRLDAEGPREVHLVAEARYEVGGPVGGLLDLLWLRGLRRQALRDALWFLKQRAEATR